MRRFQSSSQLPRKLRFLRHQQPLLSAEARLSRAKTTKEGAAMAEAIAVAQAVAVAQAAAVAEAGAEFDLKGSFNVSA